MEALDLLLVEDDERDANQVRRLLVEGDTGHLPRTVDTRRAASLSAAREHLQETPDAVLLDLNLPDSDGLETVEGVVERAPHVPVVVVTGRAESDLGPAAIQRGAQDYLRKGHITAAVLHRTLRYAIDRAHSQQELDALNRRLALLNRLLRREVRDDLHRVVGHADALGEHVAPPGRATLAALTDAANDALDRTRTAGDVMRGLDNSDPVREPLDIAAVVASQVERARDRFDATITVDSPPDGAATVETSPALGPALGHLLENAVHHNDNQTPQVTVTVESTPDTVTVTVADDGVGIPQRQRALLNDPEARYHEESGLGTGLYFVATALERVGATLAFEANDPAGTVVTVTLPRSPDR